MHAVVPMTRPDSHPHPRRAARAKRIAQTVAVSGFVALAAGMAYLFAGSTFGGGWPVALIPAGATAMLLAAIWYFSYMEQLEPELYEHDVNVPSEPTE